MLNSPRLLLTSNPLSPTFSPLLCATHVILYPLSQMKGRFVLGSRLVREVVKYCRLIPDSFLKFAPFCPIWGGPSYVTAPTVFFLSHSHCVAFILCHITLAAREDFCCSTRPISCSVPHLSSIPFSPPSIVHCTTPPCLTRPQAVLHQLTLV